jgi:hypothetical protein
LNSNKSDRCDIKSKNVGVNFEFFFLRFWFGLVRSIAKQALDERELDGVGNLTKKSTILYFIIIIF